MTTPAQTEFYYDDSLLHPSLKEAIGDTPLDRKRAWDLAMVVEESEEGDVDGMEDRRDVCISDGNETVIWRVESLKSLFRGTARAPSLEKFPKEYVPLFSTIEEQVLMYARIFDEPTDEDMRGVYSNLARLPDGKGHSLLHNHMWQACALALGTRPWSSHQLEAVLRRLQRSCRTFHTHPGSKNYLEVIRRDF